VVDNGEQRTDKNVRSDVLKEAEIEDVKHEDWQSALSWTLEDIYANTFCFRKDAEYIYFVKTMAASLKLINKVNEYNT
jgi:hypothetical protein